MSRIGSGGPASASLNPAELGYYERRPGSGIWYRLDGTTGSYEPRVCKNPDCPLPGGEFMARRGKITNSTGRREFCSLSCVRQSEVGYKARHRRVYMARSRASEQQCVDCGNPAEDWSQIHGTDGTKPAHYEPRCTKCHMAYDTETVARGESKPNAVLTEARVRGIRASVDENGNPPSAPELAEIHGVSREVIRDVRRGKTWRHVK